MVHINKQESIYKYGVLRFVIIVLLTYSVSSTLHAQAFGNFGFSYGKGFGEMEDLSLICFNGSAGYQSICSKWGFGIFGGIRQHSRRKEILPMYTESSGYSDGVEVRNTGQSSTLLAFCSYSNDIMNSRWAFFSSLGLGFGTYYTFWVTTGEPKEDSPTFLGRPTYINHLDDGVHLRNMIFNSSGELGVEFRWKMNKNQCEYSSSGIYCRAELGNNVKYMNPREYQEHFYYESGLGQEKNTPFGTDYYREARHFTIALRVVLVKVIL